MCGDCGRLYKKQDGDIDNNRLSQSSDYEREPPPPRSEVEWVLGNFGNGKAPGILSSCGKPQEKKELIFCGESLSSSFSL